MIEYETRGNVALITIDRPEASNAVNGDVAEGIEAAIDRMEADDEIWIGVLTHEGPVFCAGADLKAINSGDAARLNTPTGGFGGITAKARTKPIIAALQRPRLCRRLRDRPGLRPRWWPRPRSPSACPR
jgi:enoyl-CoA hydratase